MCKCDNWHDILIWINFGMAIDLIVFGVLTFLTAFIHIGSGWFLTVLFPVYYV